MRLQKLSKISYAPITQVSRSRTPPDRLRQWAQRPSTARSFAWRTTWRAVILFGRNVATYKFALGKSLLELAQQERDFVTLEELAEPFSRHPTLFPHP